MAAFSCQGRGATGANRSPPNMPHSCRTTKINPLRMRPEAHWRGTRGLGIDLPPPSKDGTPVRSLRTHIGFMPFEDQIQAVSGQIVEFVRVHEAWAAPIVGALAFGE